MAGVHDASGPAPSGSAGIVVQKTGELASSDKGKLRVFISYSRDDLDFADQLVIGLELAEFAPTIDRQGISSLSRLECRCRRATVWAGVRLYPTPLLAQECECARDAIRYLF